MLLYSLPSLWSISSLLRTAAIIAIIALAAISETVGLAGPAHWYMTLAKNIHVILVVQGERTTIWRTNMQPFSQGHGDLRNRMLQLVREQ